MPRGLTTARRNSLEASQSSVFDLILLRMSGGDIHDAIGICNDTVNYVYNSEIYFGVSAEIALISDGERAPKSTLRMQNVYGVVGKLMQALTVSPRLTIRLFNADDWSPTLSSTGETDDLGEAILARNPIASPAPRIDYEADWLRLTDVSGDALSIEANIGSFDLSSEPFPAVRTTRERLPGLYR